MNFDVIGFGALNFDILYTVRHLSQPGGHEPILGIHKSPGGSAANTICGLSKLGFKTGFLGSVGSDHEGRKILSCCDGDGVAAGHIQVYEGVSTGLIIGFVDKHGERTLYPYPSANNQFKLDPGDIEFASQSKIVHFTSFVGDRQFQDQVRLMSELPESVKISFGPGDLYVERGFGALKEFLKRTNYLFVNRSEIEQLTGQGFRDGARFLLDVGVSVVLVTLGEGGCLVASREQSLEIPSERVHQSDVVDTTGAGDSFAAGFLAGQLWDKSFEESARLGVRYAASCITALGARTGLCGKDDFLG
ncbi:MAG: carbohydrate kinase family protein [Candidatus Altiarchaeota archaeon]